MVYHDRSGGSRGNAFSSPVTGWVQTMESFDRKRKKERERESDEPKKVRDHAKN